MSGGRKVGVIAGIFSSLSSGIHGLSRSDRSAQASKERSTGGPFATAHMRPQGIGTDSSVTAALEQQGMTFVRKRVVRVASPVRRVVGKSSTGDWIFLGILSLLGFALGLRAIYHDGYIGQDFTTHRDLILSFPKGFSYAGTNPPGLYLFGSVVRFAVGDRSYLQVMAREFLVFNTMGLWIIYSFLRTGMASRPLWYAACAFITFIPFRVIHSLVLSSDAFTLPLFAVVALFTHRLFENPRNKLSWIGLSAGLLAAMFFKYTFVGLLPPIVLLLAVSVARNLKRREWLRWSAIGGLALALPAGAFLLQIHEGHASGLSDTEQHWLPKGAPSVMRWRDILLVQKGDVRILSSPSYKYGDLSGFRNYSYLGLLHVSSFSDVFNFFQQPISPNWADFETRLQNQLGRTRSVPSQALQVVAVRWCMVYSLLAIVGTLTCIVACIPTLFGRKTVIRSQIVVLTSLAVGYYSIIFLSLHRLSDPYRQGYWLPRLILPALLVFFVLGFVVVDVCCELIGRERRGVRAFQTGFASYTYAACILFVGFLS